jgi:hypothetical protein
MAMAQKLQMRAAGASAEALSMFDIEHAAVARKCRRRAVDFLHIEQIAALCTRKHPRRRGDRQRRGGSRGGAEGAGSAPSSRAPSAPRQGQAGKPP